MRKLFYFILFYFPDRLLVIEGKKVGRPYDDKCSVILEMFFLGAGKL